MKKTWNSPEVQELTIQATAHGGYGNGGYGNGGYGNGGYGNGGYGNGQHGNGGNSDLCRCQGGTSPCSNHHGWDENFES